MSRLLPLMLLSACVPVCRTAADTAQDAPSFQAAVKPFLARYCVSCHGAKQQKGERRLDLLDGQIRDTNSLVDLQDVLDQLNLGDMPPEKATQPTIAERRAVIGWLDGRISRYHELHKSTDRHAVLRRLNSREYRNTLRDLLHLNMTMFDPTATFPLDQSEEHLDNLGETLVTSGFLLARYLEAAETAVHKSLEPRAKPVVQTWTFRDDFRQQPEIDQVHRKTNQFAHMTLYDVVGADKHEGAYGPLLAFKQGVPSDGYYDIKVNAEAVNRRHPYDPEFLGLDPEEPLRLGIVAGNQLAGQLHKPQPIEPLLAEIDLADESRWYTRRVWLDKGFTPRFTFRNGLMDVRNLWSRIIRQYPDQFPKLKSGGIVEARLTAIKYGKLPQIHIHEVQISGPHRESWPTASQRTVLGTAAAEILSTGTISGDQMRSQLRQVMTRAFRRPVVSSEVDRIMHVIDQRQAAGRSPLDAYADGVKAVLCSPHFLYLEQPDARGLSPTGLASRLSYFLWSSLPDETLMKLAAIGELKNPEVLEAEVDRMLSDPRSNSFIDGFFDSWLTLRDLGSTPPERSQFRVFYQYDLDAAMRQETRLFARHLLTENLDVVNFLDSDVAFVNKPLAKLYGLQPPAGSGFSRVDVDDPRRGGLLGQASVLTVTANGIDTSPVVRGVWLLENILGTPPSPPPPDVEPLDPDIRGAKTIRDQLEKHRDNPTCYDCHRKIDPLGFALENFDPIGRWRTSYGRSSKIDSSGKLPNGKAFQDVVGLKKLLVEQRELFTRALTTKLLAYALGRQLEAKDRPAVDQIVRTLAERGNGFRDLVKLVVASDTFRASIARQ